MMLVLSRRFSERLVIDSPAGRVILEVLAVGENKVRLGILAPDDHLITRSEAMTPAEQGEIGRLLHPTYGRVHGPVPF